MLTLITKVFRPTWRVFALFVVALVLSVTYMLVRHNVASTKDARVVTNVIPIATTVSGVVSHVNVVDNQYVKAGQSLFELNSDAIHLNVVHGAARLSVLDQTVAAFQDEYTKAQQLLAGREMRLMAARKELERVTESVQNNNNRRRYQNASVPAIERATERVKTLEAKVEEMQHAVALDKAKLEQKIVEQKEAEAAYHKARSQMAQLVVRAPTSGYISNLSLQVGTVVKSYHNLFGIIQPAPVWVIANFLETELVHIRPGQSCRVTVTMYPGEEFDGEVESIGYGIAPDTESRFNGVLPTVAPDSSWVRLSQRFPVRIRVHNPHPNVPMRVGANARVKIYTYH